MFTLLAPLALAGSLLLAVPIVVHLFKPRKVRQTPFSSLRWLRASQQQLSRRMQWHQLLLFLLRALFLIALVFALAKPVISLRGKHTFAERFIILDVSRSMNYQTPDRPTPFDLGRDIAGDLLLQSLAGDRTTLLLTGNTTTALGPLMQDPLIYRARLQSARAGFTETDLTSALQTIRPMLVHKRPNTSVELYFITDNHQQSWSQGAITSFMEGLGLAVNVHVIDVGIGSPQNAWIADARLIESSNPPRQAIRVQLGCVGDEGQRRTVRVTHLPGLPELSAEKIELHPGHLVQTEIEIPGKYDFKGKVADIRIDPKDALPSDDQFCLNLDSRGMTRVLILEPEATQIESLQPGFHFRTALEAISYMANGSIQSARKAASAVVPRDFAEADLVVMADVPQLSDAALVALENRVRAGAGLMIFFGPSIQLPFYNTRLFNATRPAEGLLPAPLKNLVQMTRRSAPLAGLTRIQWTHPILAPLFDPAYGDLALTRFLAYYDMGEIPAGSASQVLALIDDKSPAILERTFGSGKVLIFNTTANDEWTDLPRRKSYLPLLDRSLSHLVGGIVRRIFQVGEVIAIPVGPATGNVTYTVTSPGGKTLKPITRQFNGQTIVRLDSVDEIGIYAIQPSNADSSAAITCVVQPGRGDSVLKQTELETLKSWWQPAAVEIARADPNSKNAALAQGRILLWPWLIGLGCVLLLAEMFFVHWLCPRVNPKIIASSVTDHGIMARSTR